MPAYITGIDIGSHEIKGIVAEEKRDGQFSIISVIHHPSEGFHKGVLVDVDGATQVLRGLVLDLQKISKKTTQNVFVNVNSDQIQARNSRGIAAVARADREIQQDDVDRVIQASQAVKLQPNHIVLHNIIREYLVDDVGDIHDPLGMTGHRLEVSTLMIEAFTPQVTLLIKTLERVGIHIEGLIFNPLASARSVLTKRQKDLGTILIDFGFGTTSFVVYEENKVSYTKTIPVGMGYVTNDIAMGLKISVDAAEKLKLTYGHAIAKEISKKDVIELEEFEKGNTGQVPRRFVGEIIEVRLAEILELINNEVKALGRDVQLPGGAVIVGGGTKLPGMTELVKRELKLHTQIGFPNLDNFEILNPTHRELLDDPVFSTATGLLSWGDVETGGTHRTWGVVKNFFENLIP